MRYKTITFAALTAAASCAQAGRPLTTDDASTAEQHTCQIEVWQSRASGDHANVAALACGVAQGLELGVDATRPSLRTETLAEASMGLKWAPPSGVVDTSFGKLKLGARLGLGALQSTTSHWSLATINALALATLEVSPTVSMHFNLGPTRDRESGATTTFANLAGVWAPIESALLFAEVQMNDHHSSTQRAGGARWWLIKDELGLDLTATRRADGGPTQWSVGFGWYGLGGK